LNFKILYSIIAVALVGGMFSAVYAGTVPTITLDGNMHTTGDADVDGNLNVDGAITGPTYVDLDTRITALEGAPPAGGPTICDTDGDGAISDQEMYDYLISVGWDPSLTLGIVQTLISTTEFQSGTPNGLIDDNWEISNWNMFRLLPDGNPPCPYF